MSIVAPEAVLGNAGLVALLDAVDYSNNIKEVTLEGEDKDDSDLTFAEAASGDVKDYAVTLKSIASTAVGSLWRYLWDNPGGEFPFVYGPHGNAVPTEDKPHFLMTLKADGRPTPPNNTARRTKDRGEFEATLQVVGAIVLDDGVVTP